MKKVHVILVFCLASICVIAQPEFYSIYDGWEINKVFKYNDNYIACGLTENPSTTSTSIIQFNYFDSEGNPIDSFSYSGTGDGLCIYRSNAYYLEGDTLYFVGAEVDEEKSYTLNRVLFKYDLSSREMESIVYFTDFAPGSGINYLIDTTNSGFIIAAHYNYLDYTYFPMLIFTNTEGDTLLTKKYTFLPTDPNNHHVVPYQLLRLPDGGFLLSCQDEFGYPYNGIYPKVRSWFMRLDSQGNELWRRTTASQDTLCFHPFAARMDDGDYLITWTDPFLYDDDMTPLTNYEVSLWFARMTDSGVIYNKQKLEYFFPELTVKRYYVNDYYQDFLGNVFFIGTMEYPNDGFLIKVNNHGIPQWLKTYKCFPENPALDAWTKLYGLTPTPDGGFIMGGEYMSPNSTMFPGGIQKGLAIKVDSCGCLEENCNPLCDVSIGQQFITAQNAQIYPNPATDLVNIELNTFAKTVNVQVFDAEGCLWINTIENSELSNPVKLSLDISGLAAGIYTVNIWADGKLFTGKFVKV